MTMTMETEMSGGPEGAPSLSVKTTIKVSLNEEDTPIK
jgi:hypothetical protein